ncbi:TPA: hypothetical protein DIC62_03435 [Candidatus Nomurabacteria bacterium]|nr:hypothetical protein [Candidatus Nomurabacteria bacterium]
MPVKYLEQIGETKLKKWLYEEYDLNIESIVPIPKGEIGDNYVVEDINKQKYFLKIYLQSKLHIDNPNGLKDSLKLTSQLHDAGIENVPYPIKLKNNELEGKLETYSITVTSYINGCNPVITSDLKIKFGEILAKIHQVKTENINLPIEPFNATYANKLAEQIKILEQKENLNKFQLELSDLLLPNQDKLKKHLFQFNELCENVKLKNKQLVVTHGDLIPDNLMVNGLGKVFIVDWDTARLSPPERDVWFFIYNNGQDFIQTYKAIYPSQDLDIDLLSFYMYKRYIEDLVYWADQILFEDLNEKQNQSNLKGIKISCLEAFHNIEEKVENMKNLISQ